MAEEAVVPQEQATPAVETATPEVAQERPDFLDPRFNSVEEQAKAYREAEKMMQHKAQIASELERQNRELLMRQQAAIQQPPVQENYDELFWQKPSEVIAKLIDSKLQAGVQPFIEDRYSMQKEKYRTDPNFSRYESQIDQMVTMQPDLKKQAGVVDKLYRAIRAMEFDPVAERKLIEEDVRKQMQGKAMGLVEGAGVPGAVANTPKVQLSEAEQSTALKLYGDLNPRDAYKKYAEAKARMQGGN